MFHTYLLRCANQAYYCGHTDNLDQRMQQHHDGLIGYTAKLKPFQLVWQGEFGSRAEAIECELKIKGWTRAKKEALIVGDWGKIKALAKPKQNSLINTVRPELVEGLGDLLAVTVKTQPSPSTSSGRTGEGERTSVCELVPKGEGSR
jgi:predicted GIY-YIG superfamily endonuclease